MGGDMQRELDEDDEQSQEKAAGGKKVEINILDDSKIADV